jgi:hypothetical protein
LVRSGVDAAARARVELQGITEMAHVAPLAVEDRRVRKARVTFINERTGAPIKDINGNDVVQDLSLLAGSDTVWSSAGTPSAVNVTASDIGARLALSFNGTSLACSDADVTCLDAGSANGLVHLHGYDKTAVAVAERPPVMTNVDLTNGATVCNTSPFFTDGACEVKVDATVQFTPNVMAALATESLLPKPDYDSIATVETVFNGATTKLAWKPGTILWQGTLAVPAGAGRLPLKLGWTQSTGKVSSTQSCSAKGNPGPCRGYFDGDSPGGVIGTVGGGTAVHRVFSANADSNPATSAAIIGPGGVTLGSVAKCAACLQSLAFTVSLPAPLKVGDHRLLAVKLDGSNDQLLDCDGNGTVNLVEYVAKGCPKRLATNPNDTCSTADLTTEPFRCVDTFPGAPFNPVTDGLTWRVYYPERTSRPTPTELNKPDCTKNVNHWPDWNAVENDPRLTAVVLAKPGQFDINGKKHLPVKEFAVFYITGWSNNPCQGQGDNETVGDDRISGYFVKYALPNDGSVTAGGDCNESTTSLGGCVPVMTR